MKRKISYIYVVSERYKFQFDISKTKKYYQSRNIINSIRILKKKKKMEQFGNRENKKKVVTYI